MIDSGKLRHRVTWYSATETNTDGKISNTYTSNGTFWAFVKPMQAQESVVNDKVQATISHTVTMRKVGDIKQKDKLLFKGRTLQVESVINTDEQNYELILSCREVAA